MAYDYDIPITLFPGGVAPESWVEFIARVEADAGITSASLEDLELRFVTKDPLVLALRFDVEPTGDDRDPGPATLEKLIIDDLAAASAGTTSATIGDFLADFHGEGFSGYFADFGAATSTASGPATRMDESPTLAGGIYLIDWTAEVSGTTISNVWIARFVFDRAGDDEFIDEFGPISGLSKFNGSFAVTLEAGTYQFELEIEKDTGGGSSELAKTTMRYIWLGSE